jgi:hypothetical protein
MKIISQTLGKLCTKILLAERVILSLAISFSFWSNTHYKNANGMPLYKFWPFFRANRFTKILLRIGLPKFIINRESNKPKQKNKININALKKIRKLLSKKKKIRKLRFDIKRKKMHEKKVVKIVLKLHIQYR